MFYLMSPGLVWLDLHVLVIESHSATAHAHTPQYRDILIPFFAWLVRQFTRAEGPWLNFPPKDAGAYICVHFHIEDGGAAVSKGYVRERAYAMLIWGVSFEAEHVRKHWLPSEGKLWRE